MRAALPGDRRPLPQRDARPPSAAHAPLVRQRESDLYQPVKQYLEAFGYTVRGEVGPCDIVAIRDNVIVAVELKLTYCLAVLYQALRRLPAVDFAYVAVAAPTGRAARVNWDAQVPDAMRLCRMLGLGLISVRDGRVVVHADPTSYRPRKQPKHRARLLGEFSRRSGDHNLGGTNRRPRVTAYREDALACAWVLAKDGAMKAAAVRAATGVEKAGKLLRDNVYDWFEKISRGTYRTTDRGRIALEQYADVLASRVASE